MRITSFNVNGMRSFSKYVMKSYKMRFNEYVKDILRADILCVQETRGNENALGEFHSLRDYVTFTSVNKRSSGRSGVSTVVSKKLYCRGVIHSPFSEEGRSLLTDHGEFKILNLYFPFFDERSEKDKSEVIRFYDEIGAFIRVHEDAIICGDFNAVYSIIDHYQFYNELLRIQSKRRHISKKEEIHEIGRKAKKFVSKTELPYEFYTEDALEAYLFEVQQRKWLKSLIDGGKHVDAYRILHKKPESYTCWNTMLNMRPHNLGTRIDYILIPSGFSHRFKDCNIQPEIYGSDHCPVYVEIDFDVMDDGNNILGKRKNNILDFFGL
ncbi:exonuclease III [Encephalitozoon hellem ATCC 50504]|uniref:Exodeoxyribonuclease n=1 Tax=Encephalitozoon hellem TaxID=27973 RepID=A0A9Q9CCJ3_ENCHE|nr:exonuclease III [Encephalitozoon hellem ATCC 50504]AFM98503.1 exonuclease III [Encephalitozoon hellem ATCC 50504]UTX43429.1 exodeoxyribonuclease [Encephalitozoon hellem]WEL38893.1 exodeoxyribonuclease [Encephalitozoon hellem]|eukprot:XP_003887484.1 exonuclease III [Encephalitozoon hellem ATCC 50504]